MVGKHEAARLSWIWLHHVLGFDCAYLLDMSNTSNMDRYDNDEIPTDPNNEKTKTESLQQVIARHHIDFLITRNLSQHVSYSRYISLFRSHHVQIITLITAYCGHLFGWKPPWICQDIDRLYKNLKIYKRIYSYPSQSLMDDDRNENNKQFMQQHNANNVLSDCVLVCTHSDGYWLGNLHSGHWYRLGLERPYLSNLHTAMARGSMSIELFPRSDRLYFSGGFVCSMPISTVVELDLDSMKLGILSEMENPRAYLSMHFYPDSIVFVGGTNCWQNVYKTVERYDLLEHKYKSCASLQFARYGHGGITINERYLFVAGGCDRFYSILNCELYDRKTNQWSTYSSMLQAANKANVIKYKDDIFVVGAKSRQCQIFSFEKKKWRFAPKLNRVHNHAKFCTFDYRLIAMDRNDISRYEIFDEASNRWYSTDIRNHPVLALYPKPFMHSKNVLDWFHLGRRYW